MPDIPNSFEFDHSGSTLRFRRGAVECLGEELDSRGLQRALVVCGSHVGANRDLMDPIVANLGDRLVGVFDGTTPEKLAESVYEGIDTMKELDVDVLVGVGGGSSLDTTRQMSAIEDDGRSLSELRAELSLEGAVTPPAPQDPTPVVLLPTTLAGADISTRGSVEVANADTSPTGQPVRTSGTIVPFTIVYDPDLYETTPRGAIAGSAMNGFNKGIETLYAADATPITDALAIHGLSLLADGLRRLDEPDGLDNAVAGTILVQIERKISILHAFGHGLSRRYDLQQGVAHAVVTPAVLRYVFDTVDGRRSLISRGLGLDSSGMSTDEVGEEIVSKVTELRDGLGLPSRIRELAAVERRDIPDIAEFVVDDPPMKRAPPGLDPTSEEIQTVLQQAW